MRWLWLFLCPVLALADTSDNVLMQPSSSSNVAYNYNTGTFQFSYTTGQVTAAGILPQYDPLNVLTLNWSFEGLMNCNNSYGGYCGNPNGTQDKLEAFLEVGNSQGDVDIRQVFSKTDYFTDWQTFSGTETYDFSRAYEGVIFRMEGIDRGYWAGYYGPKVRNPSVVAIYTPIPTGDDTSTPTGDYTSTTTGDDTSTLTGPDCTNPLNDPSCDGYWDKVAESTVTDKYTDTVFGDEIEDFYKMPEGYEYKEEDYDYKEEDYGYKEDYKEEEEYYKPEKLYSEIEIYEDFDEFLEDEPEDLFEQPLVFDKVEEYESPVELKEPALVEKPEEPTLMAVETGKKLTTLPTEKVDVVSIALALAATTTAPTNPALATTTMTSTVSDTSETFEQVVVEVVPNPTQPQQQSYSQGQPQAQEETPVPTQELAPPADIQFEQDFNDAIGAGQNIGQFLSAQLPDFSRFDVAPPSQQEQRTTQRVNQALQSMSRQDIAQSTEAQLEEMKESGGFSDQSLTVLLISNNPDFNQYNNISLDDRSQFYENRIIYRGNAPADNARALLRGSGTRRYEAMVDQQWQR